MTDPALSPPQTPLSPDPPPKKRRTPSPAAPDALLRRIRREYERIAFDGGDDARTADRIKVMELLRELADEDRGAEAPPLRLEIVYVDTPAGPPPHPVQGTVNNDNG